MSGLWDSICRSSRRMEKLVPRCVQRDTWVAESSGLGEEGREGFAERALALKFCSVP